MDRNLPGSSKPINQTFSVVLSIFHGLIFVLTLIGLTSYAALFAAESLHVDLLFVTQPANP